MPPLIHPHATTFQPQSQPKPTPNLLSLFLKPIIMILLTSLFFLFMGLAAFLLLHLFLIAGALHRIRSRPSPSSFSRTPTPSDALSPSHVTRLPSFRLSRGSSPGPDSRCVVCLDGFRTGQWCRKLAACGHVFHRRCVDTWLIKVAACPTCRTPVRWNASPLSTEEKDASAQFWTCGAAADANSLAATS